MTFVSMLQIKNFPFFQDDGEDGENNLNEANVSHSQPASPVLEVQNNDCPPTKRLKKGYKKMSDAY